MRNTTLLIIVLLLSTLLNSCSTNPSPATQSSGVQVLAAESFLGDIAQNVAGERLKVETLISPGVDPHEFEPKPQDIIRITQSQALIVNGLGYEAWLKTALETVG